MGYGNCEKINFLFWTITSQLTDKVQNSSLNSNVYSCFLDASKAFDRVNHSVLFDKLVKRGVPLYLVRLIVCWYIVQNMYIRWNNTMSDSFSVTNGVRQGTILSPYCSLCSSITLVRN